SPKMTIARVHGYCLGLGLDVAMMCETIVATEDAVLGDPSIRLGLATQNPLWTWRVGPRRAKELLLTGRYMTGAEALRLGLVTIACPRERLEEEVNIAAEGMIHRGGMGGYDSYIYGKLFNRATWDGAGLAAAWSMTAGLHGLSAIQRRGFRPDEFNFWNAREKSGMKGAIKERDARVKQLFPWKKPS
ncbi:MAG: enoyl-CoA hydratase/isomerase family protein, partial [Chloroflexota bacterium]